MSYIVSFVTGFLTAYFGLIVPSMLNMTAARTSIERGRRDGILFAAGAATVVFVQGMIAVTFAKYLVAHPEVITKLKTAAIAVLLGLSFFFYTQARKKFKAKGKQKKGSAYVTGLVMSSLNMLAIPFYLAMATLAESKGLFKLVPPFSVLYVVGAVGGAFALFSTYVIFSEIIARRAQFIARNINYILSGLFMVLAAVTAFQVFVGA